MLRDMWNIAIGVVNKYAYLRVNRLEQIKTKSLFRGLGIMTKKHARLFPI